MILQRLFEFSHLPLPLFHHQSYTQRTNNKAIMGAPVEGSSAAPSKGPLLQLIAIGLLLIALVFAIVAAATTGWIYVDTTHIGLFNTCSGPYCVSTLELFSNLPNSGECKSQDRAAQGFIVLSILFIFPSLFLILLRRFFGTFPPLSGVLSMIPWIVDVAISVAALVFLTITWTIAAGMSRKCICDNIPSSAGISCALNYSWALAFIAWFFVLVTSVIVLLTKGEVANALQPIASHSTSNTTENNAAAA
ncbi:membrane-associated protein, putative [Bodo saltans]|uniref:Membrane-associated protein, putative n=1 Tax=Bodo saltans TaxID=75058 RepID=A0A0S4IZK5_BODSA|nr:membrane-associated protein, putative [Bodo saltans]|eukprot:CUG67997.1 membrane-associated protein, putative [Bodo saltans]